MKRSTRAELAQETLQIIENGFYQNILGETVSIKNQTEFAVKNSLLFRPEDFPSDYTLSKVTAQTKFEITSETTLAAAKRMCQTNETANPFVLNFASAKNPGGGFLSGSEAQEESLARSSSLYACQTANFEMYEFNRRNLTPFYSDYMIYSPRVPVFRNDDGSLLTEPHAVAFLTAPAANAGVVKQKEPDKIELIETVNRERARKFLWIANQKQHKILILGAWGCGVFQNDENAIAKAFDELLKNEFANCFETVIMAIYDSTETKRIYQAFAKIFA